MSTWSRLAEGHLVVDEGTVHSVAFRPDDTTLAAGYASLAGGSGVVLWNVAEETRLPDGHLFVARGSVRSVAYSPDGTSLATSYSLGVLGKVVCWDATMRKLLTDPPVAVFEGHVGSVAYSPDGTTLAAGYVIGGSGGGVVLWEAREGKRLARGPPRPEQGPRPERRVQSRRCHSRRRTHRRGHVAGVVLWEVGTWKRLVNGHLIVPEGIVQSVALTSDPTTLAAGYSIGSSGGVVLWDVTTRKRLSNAPLAVPEGTVLSVAFNPEGTILAAGYALGGVRRGGGGVVLWDVTTRKRLADGNRVVPKGGAEGVAFRSGSGRMVLRDLNLESLKRRAGRIANRNLTRDEWREYLPADQPYRKTFDWLPEAPDA